MPTSPRVPRWDEMASHPLARPSTLTEMNKMKSWIRVGLLTTISLAAVGALWWAQGRDAVAAPKANLTAGFTKGALGHKSLGALTFDKSGLLLIADSAAGAVYALDLGDKKASKSSPAKIDNVGASLAGRLGTTPDMLTVLDLAVHPVSKNIYIAVQRKGAAAAGNFALLRIDSKGAVSPVDLGNVSHAKATLPADAPQAASISDLAVVGNRVLVATATRERFQSKIVTLPWPLKSGGAAVFSTEIYHTSHGRLETNSPIRTLTVAETSNGTAVFGALACTPVVRLPIADLKAGDMVKGTTIVELGSRNRPLQMIAYGKDAQNLLINNSVYGLIKIDARYLSESKSIDKLAAYRKSGVDIKGLDLVKSPGKVTHMDKYDATRYVMLTADEAGVLSLHVADLP